MSKAGIAYFGLQSKDTNGIIDEFRSMAGFICHVKWEKGEPNGYREGDLEYLKIE